MALIHHNVIALSWDYHSRYMKSAVANYPLQPLVAWIYYSSSLYEWPPTGTQEKTSEISLTYWISKIVKSLDNLKTKASGSALQPSIQYQQAL